MRHRRSWDRAEAYTHRGRSESRSFPRRGGLQNGQRVPRLHARRTRIFGGLGAAMIGAAAVLAATLSGTTLVAAHPSLARPNPRAEVVVAAKHPRHHRRRPRPDPLLTLPPTSTPTAPASTPDGPGLHADGPGLHADGPDPGFSVAPGDRPALRAARHAGVPRLTGCPHGVLGGGRQGSAE